MAQEIEDGTGSGNRAKVDDRKRLYTNTIESSFFEHAIIEGDAYNVNTGLLAITTDAEHALLYLKNTGSLPMTIDAWFTGTDLATNGASLGLLRAYYDIESGTIISGGATVTPVNRLGGSAKLPSATILSGGEAFTATGIPEPVLYQTHSAGSRAFGGVKLSLSAGASITITYDPNGAQPISIYTGFQFYISKNH